MVRKGSSRNKSGHFHGISSSVGYHTKVISLGVREREKEALSANRERPYFDSR